MTSKRSFNESYKRYCCVNGCTNKGNNKDSILNFFAVPKDVERRREWLIAIDRKDLLDEKKLNKAQYKVVCSAHFDDSAIITSTSKRLKHDAVPTKLLPQKSHKNIQPDASDLIKTTINTSTYENLSEGRYSTDTTLPSSCQIQTMPKRTPLIKSEICSNQSEEDDFCFSEQGTIEDEWCIPTALKVCKLCLSMDVKMYQLNDNIFLSKIYQDIMGMAPRTYADNRLPMGICWECTARLQSAASFRTKALYSDALLQDHLKNNADLTITDIENLHRQLTIPKPTMAVQEVFKFDDHNSDEQAPNILIKSEVIPHNGELEIEVGNLVSEKITIKDENNVNIEEINTNGDVKTEIDLVPTELEVGGRKDFDEFSEDDSRIVEENVYVNDMKVSLDNIVLYKSEGSTETVIISNNIGQSGQSGKDIYGDDVVDFIDDDAKANKAVVNEDNNKTEVKKKIAAKIKAKTDGDGVIVCVKGKRKKNTLQNHLRLKNMPACVCELCGYTFASQIGVEVHKAKRHKLFDKNNTTTLSAQKKVHDVQKRFECDHCHKSFTLKANLAAHMQQHQAVRRMYDCRVCGKRLTCSYNLNRHLFQHTGIRPFKCDACEKAFRSSGELRSHVDHVHLKKPRPKRDRRKVKKLEKPNLEY